MPLMLKKEKRIRLEWTCKSTYSSSCLCSCWPKDSDGQIGQHTSYISYNVWTLEFLILNILRKNHHC